MFIKDDGAEREESERRDRKKISQMTNEKIYNPEGQTFP